MNFDTNWDVEKYKTDYEPEDHWNLRKDFLLQHKDKYPEDRLVCLAQVFYNIEFMGCRYPKETMKLVAELTKDVAADHREKQKLKLQRTFVQASDAAGSKIKGQGQNASRKTSSKQDKEKISFISSAGSVWSVECDSNRIKKSKTKISIHDVRQTCGPVGEMVVLWRKHETPDTTLQRNAAHWRKSYKINTEIGDYDSEWKSAVYYDGFLLGTGNSYNKTDAADNAKLEAVKLLMNSYYTIELKCQFFGGEEVVGRDSLEGEVQEKRAKKSSDKMDEPIGDDNVGLKLLKMMGWGGGGLGKDEQGISEPVKSTGNTRRAGFGAKCTVKPHVNVGAVKDMVLQYSNSSSINDLVFSNEFSKQDRALLHKYAIRLGLKSKSYGKEGNRHLVISKKIGMWEIVAGLIKNEEQFSNKYKLLKPGELDLH